MECCSRWCREFDGEGYRHEGTGGRQGESSELFSFRIGRETWLNLIILILYYSRELRVLELTASQGRSKEVSRRLSRKMASSESITLEWSNIMPGKSRFFIVSA